MKTKLVCLIVFVLLFTSIMPNFIYATDTDLNINHQTFDDMEDNWDEDSYTQVIEDGEATILTDSRKKTKEIRENFSLGSALAGAVVALAVSPIMIVSLVITIITREGDAFSSGKIVNWYTIEDTVFGKIDLFDANYLISDTNDSDFNEEIKENVAVFYYVMKVIAVAIGLLTLIYVGIKMALSTIASDIAKYKEMLKDWFVSMVLIFAMPYIIGIINLLSSSLVEIFANLSRGSFEQNLIYQIINAFNNTSGWSYVALVLMYIVMTFYQIKFFLMYTHRMLAMGFLIVISPLITITYSTSKTPLSGKGGGKSSVFNNWFREYTVNAFLQPLHAGLYLVFINSAYEIFTVAPLLAVIFFMALSRAEKIVKNILGMRKMSSIHSMSEYMPIKRLKK